MPKSVIFTRPFLSSRMFSGLMSRWTMPSLCANWSASQICGTIASACSGVSRPALLDLPQVPAIHVFHHQVVQRARLPEIMHRDDVRMVQARQGAGFAVEPLGKARVAGRGRRQDLQRHQPVQAGLARLIDGAHAALADELKDFELGKQLGDVRNRRRHEARARGALALPASVPVLRPAFIRHSGQRPRGTSGGSGLWQLGQMRSVSITHVLFTCSLRNGGGRLPRKRDSWSGGLLDEWPSHAGSMLSWTHH